MEITQSAGEIARGESGYILYLPSGTDNENNVEVAQGDYREWIKEKIIEKTPVLQRVLLLELSPVLQ